MQREYQICKRCVMDTTDPDIEFDENGICNHCREYDEIVKEKILPISERKNELEKIINKIKAKGKGKKYNCISGISGGVDSSYMAYIAWKYNLRPLMVHVDNGWNSEESEENIKNIISKTGFYLLTYKLDWEEFKDLQRAYLKASVIDIEVLTDHAIAGYIYKVACKEGIHYLLSGGNFATELILPKSWCYTKTDAKNIKAIHKLFGRKKIKNFPFVSTLQHSWNNKITKSITYIRILNYIDYNKIKAKEILKKEFSWRDYGAKHFESIFTRFYQGYILPNKFGIDKRRAHLSSLICSEQINRKEALEELKKPPYSSQQLLEEDEKYILNKLRFTNEEFEKLMKEKPKSHLDYPNEKAIMRYILTVGRLIKPFIKY